LEYSKRFPPQFVVVSIFANDFGDFQEVLDGKGDCAESGYWLGLIRQFCWAKGAECLFVPAPWVNQLEGTQMAGNYPGQASNIIEANGVEFLDPIDEFANAQLEFAIAAQRSGKPFTASPLFNGRIGDGHFSARGARVWASAVGGRLALMIQRRVEADRSARKELRSHNHETTSPGAEPRDATRR
jgi:hypothetical protein